MLILSCIIFSLVIALHDHLSTTFTQDEATVQVLGTCFRYLALLMLFEGPMQTLSAKVRSLDMRALGMVVNLLAYYAIAIPFGCWLCFSREMGVPGLLLGYVVGTLFQIVCFQAVTQCSDWH
mmetsp:Transcript_7419/g.8975  ORF Transcript_7419/g.8975 Transcript_7419/m.8975 type:complete len:122 (-) Transcript_7419:171-536(-)